FGGKLPVQALDLLHGVAHLLHQLLVFQKALRCLFNEAGVVNRHRDIVRKGLINREVGLVEGIGDLTLQVQRADDLIANPKRERRLSHRIRQKFVATMNGVRGSGTRDHCFARRRHLSDHALAANSKAVFAPHQQASNVAGTGSQPCHVSSLVNQKNLDVIQIGVTVSNLFHCGIEHFGEVLTARDSLSNLGVDVRQTQAVFAGTGKGFASGKLRAAQKQVNQYGDSGKLHDQREQSAGRIFPAGCRRATPIAGQQGSNRHNVSDDDSLLAHQQSGEQHQNDERDTIPRLRKPFLKSDLQAAEEPQYAETVSADEMPAAPRCNQREHAHHVGADERCQPSRIGQGALESGRACTLLTHQKRVKREQEQQDRRAKVNQAGAILFERCNVYFGVNQSAEHFYSASLLLLSVCTARRARARRAPSALLNSSSVTSIIRCTSALR